MQTQFLRILCLHGKQQNAELFRTRLGRLPYKCRQSTMLFDIIEAPHELPLLHGNSVCYKTWFYRNTNGINDSCDENPFKMQMGDSIEISIQLLEDKWKSMLDAGLGYDGVLGFSQGGTMAAIMTNYPHRFPGLKFIICVGAPDFQSIVGLSSISSLHIGGKTDTIVSSDSSQSLAAKFSANLILHEQGHCIPTKAKDVSLIVDFLANQNLHKTNQLSENSGTASKTFSESMNAGLIASSQSKQIPQKDHDKLQPLCTSNEYAIQQAEELEALSAIYPDDLIVEQMAPTGAGQSCAVFSVKLMVSLECCDPPLPQRWIGQLALKFELSDSYPDTAAKITLLTGGLAMADFTLSMSSSLISAIRKEAVDNLGMSSSLACIQRAHDWLSTGGWLKSDNSNSIGPDSIKDKMNVGGIALAESVSQDLRVCETAELTAWYLVSDDSPDDELVETQDIAMITAATLEATALAAKLRNVTSLQQHCDEADHPEGTLSVGDHRSIDMNDDENVTISNSARGVWHYTVGLIGKPSAGKSTFYNAATRAALERDGRKLAEVAPHPFTTIEPNIGPGWFLSPILPADDGGIENCTAHGRDSATGHRLLPIMMKDVAGLVPGAYKGRGKGNRFLSDLCDADVLVHVVDATGRADRDGNLIVINDTVDTPHADASNIISTSKVGGSSPSQDAQWIREELHRWIYGNVKAKWHSVCRKGGIGNNKSISSGSDSQSGAVLNTAVADRLVAIFTGYKAPRSIVERAAIRAKLIMEKAHKWSQYDVHRLVAHYLCLRFPVCLALNKVDLLTDDECNTSGNGSGTNKCVDLILECQREAVSRGECAVPVSAACEAFKLTKEVNVAHNVTATITSSSSSVLNAMDSIEWQKYNDVIARCGSTGVMTAVSAAVSLRPPILCYPVSDLDTEAPILWTHTNTNATNNINNVVGASTNTLSHSNAPPRLRDCILLKPGSTVGDVYSALKRGAVASIILQGDFVRAEGRPLTSSNQSSSKVEGRRRHLSRDSVVTDDCCVLRIQTNRKSIFRNSNVNIT